MAFPRDLQAQLQREQLHAAAQDGNLARVKELLARKYPINRFDTFGKTALHYAVSNGHLPVVQELIRAGANVNAHDERLIGNTPLSDNVRECSLEMVKCLIDAGADPTIRGWMQLNAIDRAKDRRDEQASKILTLLEEVAAGKVIPR